MLLNTVYHKLFVARQEAAAGTVINLTNAGDFANKPSDAVDILDLVRLDPNANSAKDPKVIAETVINGITFSFAGGDADGDAFTWKIFAWRNENGPAELVADGTGILGTQAVVKYPHNGATATNKFWADTLVVGTEYWMKEIEATAVGGNSVSKIFLDAAGYRYFYVEIPSSVGDMAVWLGYF